MSKKLPDGWDCLPLGMLGKFSTSSVDKLTQPFERTVKLVNYMDVYKHQMLDNSVRYMEVTASEMECSRSQVQIGDILFTPSSETPDDIGHSAVIAEAMPNALHSYHTVRLRPSGKFPLDIKFSAWFANGEDIRRFFARVCAGSTRYTLTIPVFERTEALIPPFREQEKIGESLCLIQNTIEKTEALIAKYQQIKAGLMHDLFTRGVSADGKLRPPREQAPELYHETPIGWIPKEWNHGLLRDLVSPIRPIVYGILMPGYGHEGGVPVVKVKDIRDGMIDESGLLFTSPQIDQEYQRSRLQPGDILLTIRGSVGRLAIVPASLDAANITQDTARISIQSGYASFYRYFLETSAARRHFEINTLGVAVQGINLGEVRKTPVPLIDVREQKMIADRIDGCVKKLECEQSNLGKHQFKKIGLMHDLLTGKVRVKPDFKVLEMVSG